MRRIGSLLGLALMMACGCGAATGGENGGSEGASEEAIQGGAVDGKDPAVGLVWIRGGGFCTGTLIAPNVVLTAGHCVETKVASFYTGTGKGSADVGRLPAPGLVEHGVIQQITHPSYRGGSACPNHTFDVALLRLAAPIAGTAPLTLASAPPRAGVICRAVGYGVHDLASGSVVEQRHSATETVRAVETSAVRVTRKSGISDHGDSGGPLLCGAHIAGTVSCGSAEYGETFYARVDGMRDWIAKTTAAWK